MDQKQRAFVWVWALGASASVSWAQTPPDAGSLIQQVPRLGTSIRPELASTPEAPAVPATSAKGPQVRVHAFKIQGNTLLSQEQLMPSLTPYLNQVLGMVDLERAAQSLAKRYREAGWVVSAYLPAQDITQGEVLIQIEEARLGVLRMQAAEGLRGPQTLAQQYFNALLTPGQPLNADAVERARMLSNELLGLDVSSSFKKSPVVGATDVDVGLRDKPRWATDVFADNAGSRATGAERLNAMLEWRNPVGGGDLWSLAFMHSQGSDSARLGLGVPVGRDGWRVGGSASRYQFRLVSPEFAALDATGTVQSLGLEASYPLLRQRARSLSLLFNADHKTMDNRSSGITTSHYSTQMASVALQGRQSDDWLGQSGSTWGQLGLSSGQLNLNGSPTQSADAVGARTQGGFTKWRAHISRWQNLAPGWALQLSHSRQWANKNLDSSEKFYIGGPDSVRAFPLSEAGGARGSLSSVELNWQPNGSTTLIGFYDHGQVRVNVDDQYLGAPDPNRISLQGAGLGVQQRWANGLLLKASWARRLKGNPLPTTNGNDQDGSLVRNRIWLSAIYSF